MGRSGYDDDCGDNWALIKWRGQVASTIRGKKGQSFLHELLETLDAMPEKRLISHDLQKDGEVCALGSVGVKRGIELEKLDPDDYDTISGVFGITHQLVREIEWINDEHGYNTTPERRWQIVRDWVAANLKTEKG